MPLVLLFSLLIGIRKTFICVVNVIQPFMRKSRKSRNPTKLKQYKISNYIKFCIKWHPFYFGAGANYFSILEKSQFPPPKKKFYNIDQHWLQNLDFLSKELHNIQALNCMLKTSPFKSSVKQKTLIWLYCDNSYQRSRHLSLWNYIFKP